MGCGSGFPTRSGAQNVAANFDGQFQGVLALRPLGKYVTGARVTLRINKKLAGFAFGIQWKIDTQQREIVTVDDYLPHEIAPQRIHVTGSINSLHIPGSSVTKEQFQSSVLSFLAHQYIEIEARDSQTDELLFYTSKAVITTRTENLQAGQIGNITLDFIAVGWKDELEPTTPVGIDDDSDSAKSA